MKTGILIILIAIFIASALVISLIILPSKALEHILIKKDAGKGWLAIYTFYEHFILDH